MSGLDANPASLDELVALLREATPSDTLLEEARDKTLAEPPTPAPPDAAPWSHLGAGALALALAIVVSPGPSSLGLPKAPARGPTSTIASVPKLPMLTNTSAPELTPANLGTLAFVNIGAAAVAAAGATAGTGAVPERLAVTGRRTTPLEPRASAPTVLSLLLDVGDVPVLEPGPGAPSARLADALRDYANERYAEAAVKLQEVVEGVTDDRAGRVAQAEFFLAKCLYHLGLYHASANAFDEVTARGAEHPYFAASLPWLAMLSEQLPEPRAVIDSVSRYTAEELTALDHEATRERLHRLRYLMGRARYSERRYRDAIALLGAVPDNTPVALEARFFEGVSHVRMHRARPALRAFRRVVDAVGAGETGGHEEPSRMRDLAWMSLARLYYSLAMQQRDPRGDRASELLSLAITTWRRVPFESEHFLDSFFEETWALYLTDQHARALGHVHAFEAPSLRDRANPEALVVRAMIRYEHCQWDMVEQSIRSFHERFDPMLAAAERAERMADTHENAFRMLVAVRRRRSRVPAAIVPALHAAYRDREISRQLANVRSIDAEARRLRALDPALLEASIGARVTADLAVLRALEVDRAGEMARDRTRQLAADLRERMNQMDTIELELSTSTRSELGRSNPRPMGPASGGPILAVQGGQVWPWDGEWWPDELPYYTQAIESRCR